MDGAQHGLTDCFAASPHPHKSIPTGGVGRRQALLPHCPLGLALPSTAGQSHGAAPEFSVDGIQDFHVAAVPWLLGGGEQIALDHVGVDQIQQADTGFLIAIAGPVHCFQ